MALLQRPLSIGNLLQAGIDVSTANALLVIPLEPFPSSGADFVIQPKVHPIDSETREIPVGATIPAPGNYRFELRDRGEVLASFDRGVADVDAPITVEEIYRSGTDAVEVGPAIVREGDNANRLDFGAGETGHALMRQSDGTVAYQEIPAGGGPGGGNASTLQGQNGAHYLNRANHTGIQPISSVDGLQTAIDGKAPVGHSHNDLYPTIAATNTALAGKSNVGHGHAISDISGAGTAALKDVPASGNAAAAEVVKGDDTRLTDARAPTAHNHDDQYYTESEVNSLLASIGSGGALELYCIVEDQKPLGTHGGTFTSGADRQRTLNTVVFNGSSLSDADLLVTASSKVRLENGYSYRPYSWGMASVMSYHCLVLKYDNGTDIYRAPLVYCNNSTMINHRAELLTWLDVPAGSDVYIQVWHRGTENIPTTGMGNQGANEVGHTHETYCHLFIERRPL